MTKGKQWTHTCQNQARWADVSSVPLVGSLNAPLWSRDDRSPRTVPSLLIVTGWRKVARIHPIPDFCYSEGFCGGEMGSPNLTWVAVIVQTHRGPGLRRPCRQGPGHHHLDRCNTGLICCANDPGVFLNQDAKGVSMVTEMQLCPGT